MGILRYIGLLFELLALITAVIYFYKYKNTALRYFLLLLAYIFLNDSLGMFVREYITDYNAVLYNSYYVINFSFWFLLYRYYLKITFNKKIVLSFFLIYIISFIINGFFENYLIDYQRLPYIIAALFLIITIVIYFIEVLNSQKVLHTKNNLLFWISVGLLIYYVGNLPFRILRNYYIQLADATILFLVNFVLTVVLNSCFIIGFIWSNKKQQF
ncbi:hypothetical protein EV197_0122 [Aquimarina brevivitae]|uniref:YhhN-like protein n=1 Tax=Aquimarina brevivitae TaxID=323412 RepID=A0A4Q7PER4_9FLAO|nr:hypothetical protein EV197_0122 [Aquimarina brevivitae]